MAAQLTELTDLKQLEQLWQQSSQRPQLIFKHSLTCPISSRAYDELHHHLAQPVPEVDYWLVAVQTARPVSNRIAEQLQVEHESPQAIMVKNSQAVWHASHGQITSSALTNALKNR